MTRRSLRTAVERAKGVGHVYLHIGDDRVIPLKEIVAMLHADALQESAGGQAFLTAARRSGRLRLNPGRRASSYVVTGSTVYASPLSTATLRRRAVSLKLQDVSRSGKMGAGSFFADTD